MRNFFRNLQVKSVLASILTIIMLVTSINFHEFLAVKAETGYITLYFIDSTAEQWVKNDNAKMKAIDNSNGHESYWMTQTSKNIWSVRVPKSAYNITFNRYSSDETTQWNSWSAGGRDENNAYYAEGSLDSDEKIYQTVTEQLDSEKKKGVTEVSVSLTTKGNAHENIRIEGIYDIDQLSSEVEGLIGVPVEIYCYYRC